MGALGHYLERAGIATVGISLIRPQTERVRPPRALWVPFELGRPLGAPGNAVFQRRVLTAALGLLPRTGGPVLVDFPDDAPDAGPVAGWVGPAAGDRTGAPAGLAEELGLLRPLYERFVARHGRTSVGNSALPLEALVPMLVSSLDGAPTDSGREGVNGAQQVCYVCDDLKAAYLEAALAHAGPASSRQAADWFWGETVAGATLLLLRSRWLASADERLQAYGRLMIVPGAQAWRAAAQARRTARRPA